MDRFQQELEKSLKGLPFKILAQHIVDKLAAQGVTLSKNDQEQLEEHLRGGKDAVLHLQRWRFWDRSHLTVDLTADDEREVIASTQAFLEDQLPELIPNLAKSLSGTVLADLRKRWRRESRLQAKELAGFRRRLEQHWQEPLDLLRMLLTLAREFGGKIDDAVALEATHLVAVLTHLHARACQVTDEMIVLLAAGFADGAMARWRTLHEIAIVTLFLQQHGEDVAIRYVAHEAIEARRAAREYMECSDRLGYEPLTEAELKEIELAAESAIARFGPAFDNQYGWAAEQLGKRAPRITDIERAASVDHFRAHYRMASHNVHANPKGVFSKLGLLGEADILLAGPSNAGVSEPVHSAAISLTQVSGVLLTLSPSLDNIVAMQVMTSLVTEVGHAFLAAHERLEDLVARGEDHDVGTT